MGHRSGHRKSRRPGLVLLEKATNNIRIFTEDISPLNLPVIGEYMANVYLIPQLAAGQARLMVIDHAGHLPHFELPDVFNPLLLEYLRAPLNP